MSDGFTDMMKDNREICLTLKADSWKNIFENVRNSQINSKGNFWSAIQHLEEQLSEYGRQDCVETKGVVCFNCNQIYNHEMYCDEGYSTISTCPFCKAKNSVRKY